MIVLPCVKLNASLSDVVETWLLRWFVNGLFMFFHLFSLPSSMMFLRFSDQRCDVCNVSLKSMCDYLAGTISH